jgi:hypothetical protein
MVDHLPPSLLPSLLYISILLICVYPTYICTHLYVCYIHIYTNIYMLRLPPTLSQTYYRSKRPTLGQKRRAALLNVHHIHLQDAERVGSERASERERRERQREERDREREREIACLKCAPHTPTGRKESWKLPPETAPKSWKKHDCER